MPRAKTSKRPIKSTKTAPAKTIDSSSATTSKISVISVITAIVILALVLLLGYFKSQFIVATVNGQPITRLELISDLEKKQGKTDLDNLVTEKLITQEAKRRNINISDSDVNAEISRIEKNLKTQGQSLDVLLAQQNVTRKDLTHQVTLQLVLKKMVGAISVSDKEIDDFINQNKGSIPEGTNATTLRNQAKQQLEQQKEGQKVQALVAQLQQKAKIDYLLKF